MHILLAIDCSDAALQACRAVAAHAGDRAGLRLTLLNVQRPPLRAWPEAGLHQAALDAALQEQAEAQLQPARELLAAAGFAAEPRTVVGAPAERILEAVQDLQPDALVLGGGRHGVLAGHAIGSVALRVAPAAACPVVLVQQDARLPAGWGPGRPLRVAAPVDGSAAALAAVQRLARCAPLLGELRVDLLHVHPGLTMLAAMAPPHDDVMSQWGGRESRLALDDAAQELAAAGLPFETHSVPGDPAPAILDFVRAQGSDAIAMATRGAGLMQNLVFGSVALRVARSAEVPVALLR